MTASIEIDRLTPVVKRMLLKKLHDYVGHSYHIYKNSDLPFTHTKINLVNEVINDINNINTGVPIKNICLYIYNLRNKLDEILPGTGNLSYPGSKAVLSEILDFCLSVIDLKK